MEAPVVSFLYSMCVPMGMSMHLEIKVTWARDYRDVGEKNLLPELLIGEGVTHEVPPV